MTISLTTKSTLTAPTRYARRRLLFVCESGTDVRIINGLSERFNLSVLIRPAFGDRAINWQYQGSEPIEISTGPAGRLQFAFYTFRWLLANAGKFEVVLAQNYGLAALAVNLARMITGLTTLLLICSPNLEYFRCRRQKGQISLLGYLIGSTGLRGCRFINSFLTDQYIVLSHYLADVVSVQNPRRVHVIPIYGVNTERFSPVSDLERQALRKRLGLPIDRFIIFFSSRIAPEKDMDSLLAAAQILKAEQRSFLLLNLSGGYQEFRQQASQQGLQDYIKALDAVHPVLELPLYYQAVDLCVQISLEEGLGFSPLEALACETPVIATNVGGLRETIRDQETGLSVPVNDAKMLAKQIGYAIDHPAEMRAMARRGRKMVVAEFESSQSFDALAQLADRLVAARATS